MEPIKQLLDNNFDAKLVSFSAIDLYLKNKISKNYVYVLTNADILDMAKLFDKLDFGYNFFNFSIKWENINFLFFSSKNNNRYPDFPFSIQYFTYDCKNDKFQNILRSFNNIKRKESFFIGDTIDIFTIIEKAKLVSKYNLTISNLDFNDFVNCEFIPLNSKIQKELLISILEGDFPDIGFNFLLKTGFLEHYWNELYKITQVEQVKDFHPEGNVWQHTMQTFKHVRKKNLVLLTALLFHDIGKAFTSRYKNNRFYRHAQIGADIAEKFLKKLEFDDEFIKKVKLLVEYHMLPEAIEKLPEYKLKQIKNIVDFNLLFELYRADISSSFKSLNYYYKAKKLINKI